MNQDTGDSDKAANSERSLKSRALLPRQVNGIAPEQVSFLLALEVLQRSPFYFTSK